MQSFSYYEDIYHKSFSKFHVSAKDRFQILAKLHIAVLLGSAAISGGTNIILNHLKYLIDLGISVDIYTIFPPNEQENDWHDVLRSEKVNLYDAHRGGIKQYDLCIYTWWRTAYFSHLFESTANFYFVQSIESRFDVASNLTISNLAESTYTLNVQILTICRWIEHYLFLNHNAKSFVILNGINKSLFNPTGNSYPSSHVPRILVEGSMNVPFKQTEYALELLKNCRIPHETWLLTPSKDADSELLFEYSIDKIFSSVKYSHVPNIMRSCDYLLKTSLVEGMFGPPLEMMHCGGIPIVFPVTGCFEYIRDEFNSYVLNDNSSFSEHVQQLDIILQSDKQMQEKISNNALLTSRSWPSIEDSSENFWTVIAILLMNGKNLHSFSCHPMYNHYLRIAQDISLAP